MENALMKEKSRAASEKRLLDTIGKMIAEKGFERISINAVSAQSGVAKILIYRYFGSVDGLMAAYIRQHDFWINFPLQIPRREELADFLKKMFRLQAEHLLNNQILKRLYRWELSSKNAMIDELHSKREKTGLWLIDAVSKLTQRDQKEVAALATIMSASIDYLVMLRDFCPEFNGIPLDKNEGWEQICNGIDLIIDQWLENNNGILRHCGHDAESPLYAGDCGSCPQ
jgi:AcrR family transcriptional regulator